MVEDTKDNKTKPDKSSLKLEVDLLNEMYLVKGRGRGRSYSDVVREWKSGAEELPTVKSDCQALQSKMKRLKRLIQKLEDKEMQAAMNEALKDPEGE